MSVVKSTRRGLVGALMLLIGTGSMPAAVAASTPPTLRLAQAAPEAAPRHKVPAGWRKFESKRGTFSVMFPDVPIETTKKLRTEIGNVASTRFTVVAGTSVTYDVMYNDYPKAGIAKVNPQLLLDAARDGLLNQTKGRLVSDKHIVLGAVPGRDQEILGADGTRYWARLVLAGNRMYQLMAIARPPATADTQTFFDSFQLLGAR
jgi:hypothetical protein